MAFEIGIMSHIKLHSSKSIRCFARIAEVGFGRVASSPSVERKFVNSRAALELGLPEFSL